MINVSLHTLKLQSWESLKEYTSVFIWKVKLYQLFSGQMPLQEQQKMGLFGLRGLDTSGLSFYWKFFTPYSPQDANQEQRRSNFLNFTPFH